MMETRRVEVPLSGSAGKVPWGRAFHVMVKPMGARCNLDCRYCFYLEKERAFYPGARVMRMSEAVLERFVKEQMGAQPGDLVNFTWQGGEAALMGVEFFRKAVELQKKFAGGRTVTNSFQTNGTLLTDEWGEFLAKEDFLVGLSVDGPEAMHDGFRVDRGGRGTWGRVMEGLRVLKKHRVKFNTLTVVHRKNVKKAGEVYAFLKEIGSGFMQFIPLVERKAGEDERAAGLEHGAPVEEAESLVPRERVGECVSEECARPEEFGGFLCAVFDEWVKRDVGRVFVQLFDSTLSAWAGVGPELCTFQERCGSALAMEHNGDLYACDHYVYPRYFFGNVMEAGLADLGNGAVARAFGDMKARVAKECRECEVRFACNGDCPKHRFVRGADGVGLSYLCAGYKRFFKHSGPVMQQMAALLAAGRAPAEVIRKGRR